MLKSLCLPEIAGSPTARLYLVFSILVRMGISFFMATSVRYLKHYGLDIIHIHLVNLMFIISMLVAEVPSGALADRYGRTPCVIAGFFLLSASTFLYGLSTNLPGFFLGEMVAAFGITFQNGAFMAWMVEGLKKEGKAALKPRVITFQNLVPGLCSIPVVAWGASLSSANLHAPWFASGIWMAAVSVLACFFLKEIPVQKTGEAPKENSLPDQIAHSLQFVRQTPDLQFVLALIFGSAVCIQVANMEWQVRFSDLKLSNAGFSLAGSGIFLFLSLGGLIAHLLAQRLEDLESTDPRSAGCMEKRFLLLFQVVIGLGIFISASTSSLPFSLSLFWIHEIGRGAFPAIRDIFLTRLIPEDKRATLLSLGSMPSHLGCIVGLILFGPIAQHWGIPLAWRLSSGLLLMVVGIGCLYQRHLQNQPALTVGTDG